MASENEKRVIRVFEQAFRNEGLEPPAIGPETVLDRNLGLESVHFAEAVVRLEQEFGPNPFGEGIPPGTRAISDVTRLYT